MRQTVSGGMRKGWARAMGRSVVLAYSGGLDTSVCVKWLADRGYRVIAFMADVGQGGSWATLAARAKRAGAARVVIHDMRREFVEEYVWPALRANAIYEGKYLLATALSRPLIAKHLVMVAHRLGVRAVAHGCTGKGNDQVRFELAVRMLDPSLSIIAPVREWEFRSREEQIDYCRRHRIPIALGRRSPYSIDQNLWGTSIEAGRLENPWREPPADTYRAIRAPKRAPGIPAYVTLMFRHGVPVRVNGRRLDPLRLIARLNDLGGRHAIGRTDMIESRVIGIKSREVYEAPAATILYEAHQDLERLVLDQELLSVKQGLAATYARLVYAGLWFTPLKRALDGFVQETQRYVSGLVRVKLLKGTCQVVGRTSPHGLYQERLATYSGHDAFDHRAAVGFIHLTGLPYEGRARLKG